VARFDLIELEGEDLRGSPLEYLKGNLRRGRRHPLEHACKLGCEGIVSKRLGSRYRSGRSPHWLKIKNPAAPAVKREAEEDWKQN
jgi:bifunctional non-homologous end joining protein LigD